MVQNQEGKIYAGVRSDAQNPTEAEETPKRPPSPDSGASSHYNNDIHSTRNVTSTRDGDKINPTCRNEEAIHDREDAFQQNQPTEYAYEEKPYSVFSPHEKRIIVLCAGLCAFFSPVSGQIYFPALNEIARDLNVSLDLVNLSITSYLIMQGLAPAFIASFSDSSGRRPAYLVCFTVYLAANLGLALQSNYAALMILRCLQSAGSSATVALGTATVADLVTSQERGVYVSYMSIASMAGPAFGPIIGGLLSHYLGWHSIFWFLFIAAAVILLLMIFLLPETCRKVVDDGSVPPPKWRRTYLNARVERRLMRDGQAIDYGRRDEMARSRQIRFPNPLNTVQILFTREAGFALCYIGLVCSSYYAVIALIPSQFGSTYGFNEIQIALCFLPFGAGSVAARLVRGRMIDSRFRKHAKRLGIDMDRKRQMDLINFPVERVRIEVAIPFLMLGVSCGIGFGWMVQYGVNLAGPLIFLFVIGFSVSGSVNTFSVLLVDIFPGRAGAASAANNLCRCWLGAGATSGVLPMINKIGVGWTTTFFGLLPVIASPILWYVMANGPKWRQAKREKQEEEKAKKLRNDPETA